MRNILILVSLSFSLDSIKAKEPPTAKLRYTEPPVARVEQVQVTPVLPVYTCIGGVCYPQPTGVVYYNPTPVRRYLFFRR